MVGLAPLFGIFNVRTDTDVSVCTWGLWEHCKTICTDIWLGGEKFLAAPKNWARAGIASNFLVWCSTHWATTHHLLERYSCTNWSLHILSDPGSLCIQTSQQSCAHESLHLIYPSPTPHSIFYFYPKTVTADETLDRGPPMCIHMQKDHIHTFQVLQSTSEFGGLWKH